MIICVLQIYLALFSYGMVYFEHNTFDVIGLLVDVCSSSVVVKIEESITLLSTIFSQATLVRCPVVDIYALRRGGHIFHTPS